MKLCRYCEEPFKPMPNKPGRIDVCYKTDCQEQDEKEMPEPDRLGGNMIWNHKTAPEIEVKFLVEAKDFAKKTKRIGAGVVRSMTESKELSYAILTKQQFNGDKAMKKQAGCGEGANYNSKLGEKRTVK
jgi:hypothetical protein